MQISGRILVHAAPRSDPENTRTLVHVEIILVSLCLDSEHLAYKVEAYANLH